ncbi:MAG: FAD-binding protein [Spirochaetaceae bacterium]|jgi:electron transfer flavoprotein alpha subunit|nr:FAD-binding protein [Spirochaetaceae bacterium]
METVNIAFVLFQASDPALLWELIVPVKKNEDQVEFWLPGVSPDSLSQGMSPAWSPVPDVVVCGLPGGGFAHTDGMDGGNIRNIEGCLHRLEGLCAERPPGLILFPSSLAGHELGVRLAARLGCGCFPETRMLFRQGERLFARKKVCGSNLDWAAEIKELPAVVTVSGGKIVRAAGNGSSQTKNRVENRPAAPLCLPSWIMDYEQSEVFPARSLEKAPLIFAAGRGLGTKAACVRLRRAAGRFGAPLGFSRPAALNGWGEIAGIIGQSGLRCAAELCVAVGVSGAAAFMAGIESVSTLIAVNPDKNAPIFRYADIGIVAGAEEFIAALETGDGQWEQN